MCSPGMWPIGTCIFGVIRQQGYGRESRPQSLGLSIEFRVVRHGGDGIGISFLPHSREDQAALRSLVKRIAASGGGAVS